MRIKFLTIIASFLFMTIAISSCLDSNNTTVELSSDATVRAFGIDTIYGKHYPFTIDQFRREIYNRDSMPMGADTILDKILIDTFTVSGWVTAGLNDTVVNISDSVDLRNAINSSMRFKIHAPDGSAQSEYTLKINVHRQDPDSLKWGQTNSLPALTAGSRKAVVYNESLFVYEGSLVYEGTVDNTALTIDWSAARTADIAPESVVSYQGKLYATATGNIYSSDDGINWTILPLLSGDVVTLTHAFTHTLEAIKSYEGTPYFCRVSGDSPETEEEWTRGEAVPADFTTTDLSSARYYSTSDVEFAILVGNSTTSTPLSATTPWFTSVNNQGWAPIEISAGSTESYPACPYMVHPSIIRYNDRFYIFGGDFSGFHQSVDGRVWQAADTKFVMPAAFKDKGGYTAVLDETPLGNGKYRQCLWLLWNDGEVWRGRLNKYGFDIQP